MHEHKWEDFGGSAYWCRKCDSWWHPSFGPMPACVPRDERRGKP